MENVRRKQGRANLQDTLKVLVRSLVCGDRAASVPWQVPDVFLDGGGTVWGTFTDACTSSKKKVQTT